MNLVIIRHGDPDYEHDTLTEHGWTEAEVLAHRMEKMNVKDFYLLLDAPRTPHPAH